MSMSNASAAPTEIDLAGKTYRMSPFNFRAMGEFLRWVQDAYLEDARRLSTALEGESRNAYLRDAVNKAETLSMFNMEDPVLQRYAMSMEGVTRLVYLSLRPNHPDVTVDQLAEILADQQTFERAFERWNRLNSSTTPETAAESGGAASGVSGGSGGSGGEKKVLPRRRAR